MGVRCIQGEKQHEDQENRRNRCDWPALMLVIGAAMNENEQAQDSLRKKAVQIKKDGNFKEAFDIFRNFASTPPTTPAGRQRSTRA